MRTVHSFLLAIMAVVLIPISTAAAEPTISSITIEGTNVLVKISVPTGVRKVTLESRDRVVGSSWAPKALKRFEAATTSEVEITFAIPRTENLEILRVRTDDIELLPTLFFSGTNQFAAPDAATGRAGPGFGDNLVVTAGPGAPPASPERAVVESDIWRVSGDMVYFFNNYRGLQVINVADPAAPVVRGTFHLAASGEQMYLLPSGHAVLLTRSWCSYGGVNDESKVIAIDTTANPLAKASETSVPGYILESRMVGNILYVVAQTYEQLAVEGGGFNYISGTKVTSIDLSNPAAPVKRNTLFLAGYNTAVYATDRYLFAVTQNPSDWYRSDIHIIDISSAEGAISAKGIIHAQGRVQDKFKLNLDGDILTVVSHRWTDGSIVKLENFNIANPLAPTMVGSLLIIQGEQLFATRFDGKRAYIVTYRRIDPLWIVDLSDPTKPAITGELHVPGWSTYLRPLGNDRLLALGIDDTNSWRVALSLFDVSDAKAPALLSKVIMGTNSSWSEANGDEKALTVLPEAGLILVPWQTYGNGSYISSVQLVDLAGNQLTARGQITDQINPRRATLHRDHVISISGLNFLSYLALDRDHPQFKAKLELAWPVDKVFLVGDYLIEIENGSSYSWEGSTRPNVRVALAETPETILKSISLPATNNLPISGAELRDGKLYLAQSRGHYSPWWSYDVIALDAVTGLPVAGAEPPPPPTDFIQTIWDTTQLPELPLLGSLGLDTTHDFGGALTAHWPKPGLLVWGGGNSWGGFWGWGGDFMLVRSAIWWGGPWYGSSGGRFLALDVSTATPTYRSEVDLSTNGWSFSDGVVANGMIYLSHQKTETIQIPVEQVAPPGDATTTDPSTGTGWNGTNVVVLKFITRHYLDVIDYADPALPLVRKPVNIPGHLQGVTHNGGVVYTLGNHFGTNDTTDFTDWLDASAYDGLSAFLVSSLSLTNWPHPVVLNGSDIFIGQATSAAGVDRWRLSDAGMFEKLSSTKTVTAINGLRFIGNLAVFSGDSAITLFDATNRDEFKLVGAGASGCYSSGDLKASDGALGRGLWRPEGQYGVSKISVVSAGP